MKIILLGLPEWNRPSKVRESMLRFENLLARKSFPLFYNWSTEYWISDSVILDPRSTDEIEMISKGKRTASSQDLRYLCAGLPSTTIGPLFNTLLISGNADPACFEYSMGFIWIHASIDPNNFEIELDTSIDTSYDRVDYMLQQMRERSWLVQAKLAMKLERSSRKPLSRFRFWAFLKFASLLLINQLLISRMCFRARRRAFRLGHAIFVKMSLQIPSSCKVKNNCVIRVALPLYRKDLPKEGTN
jgi:hypothetical protein